MNGLLFILAGIINAMPIDQANIEIMRKSLQRDIKGALFVSVGNAIGDSLYFAVVFNGLAPLFTQAVFRQIISWAGGLILISFGVTRIVSFARFFRWKKLFIITSRPLVSGLLFSILNPTSVLTAISLLKFIKTEPNPFSTIYFSLFLSGGMLWSLLLILFSWIAASWFHKKTDSLVDKFCGVVMIFIGLFMLRDN